MNAKGLDATLQGLQRWADSIDIVIGMIYDPISRHGIQEIRSRLYHATSFPLDAQVSPGYSDESDILGYCPQLLVKKEVRIIDISTGGGSGLYAGPLSRRRWI